MAAVAKRTLSLDLLTREYILARYTYRYTLTAGAEVEDVEALERRVQRGALSVGKPYLNPLD